MTGPLDADTAARLLDAARQAAIHAYAPYSDFPVGAALLTAEGDTVTGVNVENVSYGLTLCAERSAISRAVSEGRRRFLAIAVYASRRPHGSVTPCGACRQVLAEFMAPDAPVVMAHPRTGSPWILTTADLLPAGFGSGEDDSCRDTDSSTPSGPPPGRSGGIP